MNRWLNSDTFILCGLAVVFAVVGSAVLLFDFIGRGKGQGAAPVVQDPAGRPLLGSAALYDDRGAAGYVDLSRALVGLVAKASYFSEELRGRLMANGKPCDPDALTCAMRFGRELRGSTYLIRSKSTGKTVMVELTDFGPASWTDCDIDLSIAAYRAISTEHDVIRGRMTVEIFLLRRLSK